MQSWIDLTTVVLFLLEGMMPFDKHWSLNIWINLMWEQYFDLAWESFGYEIHRVMAGLTSIVWAMRRVSVISLHPFNQPHEMRKRWLLDHVIAQLAHTIVNKDMDWPFTCSNITYTRFVRELYKGIWGNYVNLREFGAIRRTPPPDYFRILT